MSRAHAPLFDVAITGGGPAGAFLAIQLARDGKSVLVLEAQATARRKVCGEFLCPRGTALLREAGLAEALGGPVVGMRIFSPGGVAVEARFPQGAPGSAVRRDWLDSFLLCQAAKAGAEVKRGYRLESIKRLGPLWNLRAGSDVFRARYLVGADGRQSFVAKALGIHRAPPSRRTALHFFATVQGRNRGFGEMHILSGGAYAGLCPTGEGELNVSLVCDAHELTSGARPALDGLLARSPTLASRLLPLPTQTEVKAAFPLASRASSVAGPDWALVGDAAGFLDPLTGEGIYQALLSALLLAESFRAARPDEKYARAHARAFGTKMRVNQAFQRLIRSPAACDWVGRCLLRSPARADAFLGLIGNVHGPGTAIKQFLFL